MKKVLLVFCVFFLSLGVMAQGPNKFNPEQFEKELHQFIASDAGLTPGEAAVFFPLFDEMHAKQRPLFDKFRTYMHTNTQDDHACLEAIRAMDNIDIEIKRLQSQYHMKFCKVLPASKVLLVIKADERFHRQIFKKMMRR